MDFCHGFLEFNPSLTLRLPGGVSFDLMKYWDGQPIRFACCERKQGILVHGRDDNTEDPWGRMFWCVQIELAEDEEDGSDDQDEEAEYEEKKEETSSSASEVEEPEGEDEDSEDDDGDEEAEVPEDDENAEDDDEEEEDE